MVPWTALAAIAIAASVGWWVTRAPRTTPAVAAAATPPGPARREPTLGAQATLSSAVVQAMVAGNSAITRGTPSDLAAARASFEQAVALDERYAPAHAGLTEALVQLADARANRPSALLPKAIEHGDVAVELNPAGARGWHALARAEIMWTRDWSRAEAHLRRAIALDPGYSAAAYHLAELLAALGRHREAREDLPKAMASVFSQGPRAPTEWYSDGKVLYLAGEYPEAHHHFAVALSEGGTETQVRPWLVRSSIALGMSDEALANARKAAAAAGGTSWALGYVHAKAGRRREAEEVLAAMGTQSTRTYVPAIEFAYVRAALGQREEALSATETAVREHSPGSELLLVDPIFADLLPEPRFRAALAALKLGNER